MLIALRQIRGIDDGIIAAKAALRKTIILLIALVLAEGAVICLVVGGAEGANELQKINNSPALFPATLAVWLIVFYIWLGHDGVQGLGWSVLRLLKEYAMDGSGDVGAAKKGAERNDGEKVKDIVEG